MKHAAIHLSEICRFKGKKFSAKPPQPNRNSYEFNRFFLHFFNLNFEKVYDRYFDHYFELSTEQLRKEKEKIGFFLYTFTAFNNTNVPFCNRMF